MRETSKAAQLPDMPAPYELWRGRADDGDVIVGNGPMVLFRFDPADRGMRNLAMIALTGAGVTGKSVAALFGVSAEHLSRLRTKVAAHGSAALVQQMGAPRKLSKSQQARVLRLASEGRTGAEIAHHFSVSESMISRLLARSRDQATVVQLDIEGEEIEEEEGREADGAAAMADASPDEERPDEDRPGEEAPEEATPGHSGDARGAEASPARIEEEEVSSRYAGAMLLHPFIGRLGADATLRGLSFPKGRRYDAEALVLASTFSFALGASSMEGAKHLAHKDAGALLGTVAFPHLRTLRPRLRDLAGSCDPIALQRSFAKAMLASDAQAPELFYADDHFVTYWGKAPVAKGYNIRRHLAEPGRDDTFVVDDAWRAVLFSSGEPRGLSVSLPEILSDLREVVGDRRVMVGFDRGGSYPKVFSALTAEDMDWVTWRRAPLATPQAEPRRSWVDVGGRRRYLLVADELVTLKGYDAGPVRQLSCFEAGKVAFQVLTSATAFKAAPMVQKLRGRWCIENTNKYLEQNHGIHWLCTYEMDTEANTALVRNPARTEATAAVRAAKADLVEAERALGAAVDASYDDIEEHLRGVARRRDEVAIAKDELAQAKERVKGVAAKVPASSLELDAKRAKPALAARALQMVCRLLAYNAELDLARRLNAYLADPDEYRAITRNLMHLGGRVAFGRAAITVSLDAPDSPRVARALGKLAAEINAGPEVYLAGDRRPITYQVAQAST